MATVQLILEADGDKVSVVVEAFEFRYGPKGEEETIKEFLERHIKDLVKRFAKRAIIDKASLNAETEFDDPFELPPPP